MIRLEHIAAVAAGAVSHLYYFNKGEHHLYGAVYVQIFTAAYVAAIILLYYQGHPISEALAQVTTIAFIYLAGLYTSLIAYRSLFHPLNKFPGPFGARISNFWLSAHLKDGDAFRKVQQLHEKYGDFVRIGSSDLSITHPNAVSVIYGQGTSCTKTAFYDLTKPMVSLQTLRAKTMHDQRRRLWSAAFSEKVLRGYEESTKKYQDRLIAQIEAFDGQPVNASKWFNLYTFDVMGDLAFGTSFKMLETSEEHWAVKLLNEGLVPVSWMFPPWFFKIMTAIPGLTNDWWRFISYCSQKLDERMKIKPVIPDIMTTLLSPFEASKPKPDDLHMLRGDSLLIIVAGSDTTAASIVHTILELARHPSHIEKLREELSLYMPDLQDKDIAHSVHLDAVIRESLRMYPPVPTAMERTTPSEGIDIGGVHVPGNMTVWSPQYAMGRKEEIYTKANEFIPERWYLYPDMVKEKTAWAPFSTGPYSCIGRPLALMNIRTTVARLIMNFDIGFPPTTDSDYGRGFEAKTREHFTMHLAELELCFRKRAKN